MPVYDIKCNECGEVSEILLRGTDSHSIHCPGCGSENVERLIAAPSMIRMGALAPGKTCCGRAERCETPPCSTGDTCHRE